MEIDLRGNTRRATVLTLECGGRSRTGVLLSEFCVAREMLHATALLGK